MNLTGFALRNQPLIFMICGALLVYSLSVLGNFPSQEDPPITVREADITTFKPGMCAIQASRHWECWGPALTPPPCGVRMTRGTEPWPPDGVSPATGD